MFSMEKKIKVYITHEKRILEVLNSEGAINFDDTTADDLTPSHNYALGASSNIGNKCGNDAIAHRLFDTRTRYNLISSPVGLPILRLGHHGERSPHFAAWAPYNAAPYAAWGPTTFDLLWSLASAIKSSVSEDTLYFGSPTGAARLGLYIQKGPLSAIPHAALLISVLEAPRAGLEDYEPHLLRAS
ncbi:hypothetical protein HAX54_037874 [Datura stramonium]|uniref:Uncharacterized protein n=1 Tax=Datura stramonium TaxID=4076 RepID=A0ABS8VJR1_DATST|nr:hypothetical protein [Datura stramonium]